MLKFFWTQITVVCLLLAIALLGFPSAAQAGLTTIHVKVEDTKASGKNWDMLEGAPDIGLCVTHSLMGVVCLPDGDRFTTISTAECPNSYDCRFSVDIPDKIFKVTVVDVDLRNNDLIGVGHCRQNDTCEVGQAIVTLDRSRK